MKWHDFLALVLAGCVGAAGMVLAEDKKPATRNPFGVVDVLAPDGKDVHLLAATVKLPGDAKDANAAAWGKKLTDQPKSIDGEWSGRWNGGSVEDKWSSGTAKIKTVGDRVYILYQEGDYKYLIDARKDGKNRLVGKYLNLQEHQDTYPWVGVVIDNERIDGMWTDGRWDFRRQAPGKE
jgi:hypothetical protein